MAYALKICNAWLKLFCFLIEQYMHRKLYFAFLLWRKVNCSKKMSNYAINYKCKFCIDWWFVHALIFQMLSHQAPQDMCKVSFVRLLFFATSPSQRITNTVCICSSASKDEFFCRQRNKVRLAMVIESCSYIQYRIIHDEIGENVHNWYLGIHLWSSPYRIIYFLI